MGKHGDTEDPKHKEDYVPKHAGGQDGYDWAKANAPTEEIPKVKDEKK